MRVPPLPWPRVHAAPRRGDDATACLLKGGGDRFSGGAAMTTRTQERRLAFLATALPPIAWVVAFFLAPLAIVWAYSFGENQGLKCVDVTGTVSNYKRATPPVKCGTLVTSV